MKNDNLINLINAINHISLNHEDLMESVLNFSKNFCKNNPKDSKVIDKFFEYGDFLNQSVMVAREGVVLAMNAITLDENISFKNLIDGCVNIESQRYFEDQMCADEDTKNLIKDFHEQLRKELFSRLYSQNKEFYKISKLAKIVLQQRYDLFMKESF